MSSLKRPVTAAKPPDLPLTFWGFWPHRGPGKPLLIVGPMRGLKGPLWGVQEENELFAANSSADRNSIRAAIGHLWDYKWLIGDEDLQLTVLVPEKPNDDLLDLCDSAGVGCM